MLGRQWDCFVPARGRKTPNSKKEQCSLFAELSFFLWIPNKRTDKLSFFGEHRTNELSFFLANNEQCSRTLCPSTPGASVPNICLTHFQSARWPPFVPAWNFNSEMSLGTELLCSKRSNDLIRNHIECIKSKPLGLIESHRAPHIVRFQ